MCQKQLLIWPSLLGARRAPERLSMAKSLRSLRHKLMKAFLQCLEWLQLARIILSGGFGSIPTSLMFLVVSRAPEGDFFEFGSLQPPTRDAFAF
jgi:hypothetical protein